MRVRCFPFVEPFSPKLAANAMPPKSKKPRQAESDPAEPRGSDGADILHLARKHFASRSAVVDVLKAVERDGMPKHFSRATQYDRRKKFAATRTMYGPLVCSILLHGVVIAVQSPAAMLVHCSENCRGFRKLLQDTYDRQGANAPWSLILYADGVSPADTMSKNDQRTFYAVYWSFQDFGPAALATEEVWFTLAVMRTTLLEKSQADFRMYCAHCSRSSSLTPQRASTSSAAVCSCGSHRASRSHFAAHWRLQSRTSLPSRTCSARKATKAFAVACLAAT